VFQVLPFMKRNRAGKGVFGPKTVNELSTVTRFLGMQLSPRLLQIPAHRERDKERGGILRSPTLLPGL